jgi:hypothetical protein
MLVFMAMETQKGKYSLVLPQDYEAFTSSHRLPNMVAQHHVGALAKSAAMDIKQHNRYKTCKPPA